MALMEVTVPKFSISSLIAAFGVPRGAPFTRTSFAADTSLQACERAPPFTLPEWSRRTTFSIQASALERSRADRARTDCWYLDSS
mmetsp:Transcript_20109/g.65806  ORF Transcript_20109/g.65806 Transcript_20109/m.65806 type:complete len:85 (-) Transcript_20109:590-844(-)